MRSWSVASVVRWSLIALLAALVLWSVPHGGQLTFAGLVLAATMVVGWLVTPERVAWYAAGVGLVLCCLALGVVHGPFDAATTGYCNSVFEPRTTVVDDAPPGTYQQCEATRRQRIPLVAALGVAGAVALGMSLRRRTAATMPLSPAA